MIKLKNIAFFVTTLLILTSCAKRGFITGGDKDTLAPRITSSYPENFKTNFKGNEIKINFDELIKVKNINKQLIISPPMKKQPIIVPQGNASKFISIKILDTLQPNTTYSFNFGQSITDNNEGNPYSQFKYVFSTGSYVDSLTVVGKIKDAYEQQPDNFVSVMLYDAQTFTDSTVYKETPLYVTNTLDSLKVFSLENLKEGSYRIVAMKDKSSNNIYNPAIDKIGFLDYPITIPTSDMFELELFQEKKPFKAEKPTQESNNKLYLGYEGDFKKTKIKATYQNKEVPIVVTKFPEKNKDSVQIFYPNVKMDSLEITVSNGDYIKSFTSKLKDLKEADSLNLEKKSSSLLSFRDSFVLKSSTPIVKIDNSKINLINKDSAAVAFTSRYNEFDQEIILDFNKEEEEKYKIAFLPGALVDFYEKTNDTLKYNVSTKSLIDYCNLKVNLIGVKRFPLILEILDEKYEVQYSQISNSETSIYFETIEPKTYILRVIYDDNSNGIWDTGNYLAKKQAEEVIYYPKPVKIPTNWDWDQDFILD